MFRRSFYLETGAAGLVCFGPETMGAGPLNALCNLTDDVDWEASGLRPGTIVQIDQARLTLGDDVILSLAGASPWDPTPVPSTWTRRTLADGLDKLAAERHRFDDVGWLAGLLSSDDTERSVDRVTQRAAHQPVAALKRWLNETISDPRCAPLHPPARIAGLIGLGEGLTPSGDDFIGGAMIALRELGRGDAADLLAGQMLPIAHERTNRISVAHLACAADGEGAAALHAAIAALCTERTPDLHRCLDDIDAIGHTSGWDALAGAVLVLTLFCDATTRARPQRHPHSTARR